MFFNILAMIDLIVVKEVVVASLQLVQVELERVGRREPRDDPRAKFARAHCHGVNGVGLVYNVVGGVAFSRNGDRQIVVKEKFRKPWIDRCG